MNIVPDTHALVWYFTNDARLSKKVIHAFNEAIRNGTIFIPAIVLAEIQYIARKNRISLGFEQTLKLIEEQGNFTIVPLDTEILRIADKLKTDLEMHDRLIVASAIYCDCALLSKDELIKKSKAVQVIW